MPIFEYRCQGCGFLQDELVSKPGDSPDMLCPLKCPDPAWVKRPSVIASPDRLKSDNERFPQRTHMRESCVIHGPNGPQLGTRPLIAKSRRHMEQLMEHHGYVHYEEPVGGGSQAQGPQMPKELQKWGQHPSVLKYKDLVKSGRVPKQMVLSEDELQERFHV